MVLYLKSLSSMGAFFFNHVKELELIQNCAKLQAWDSFLQ